MRGNIHRAPRLRIWEEQMRGVIYAIHIDGAHSHYEFNPGGCSAEDQEQTGEHGAGQ